MGNIHTVGPNEALIVSGMIFETYHVVKFTLKLRFCTLNVVVIRI